MTIKYMCINYIVFKITLTWQMVFLLVCRSHGVPACHKSLSVLDPLGITYCPSEGFFPSGHFFCEGSESSNRIW